MSFFGKLFGKKSKPSKKHSGYFDLVVGNVEHLNRESVRITFQLTDDLQRNFEFYPGQYVDLILELGQEQFRRSYSICSIPGEPLAIAVKTIPDGKVSNWLKIHTKIGDRLTVSTPKGSFYLGMNQRKVLAIAAGSGITPIFSMLRDNDVIRQIHLLYGNKTYESTLFLDEIHQLTNVQKTFFYSREHVSGSKYGRITEMALEEYLTANPLLKEADAFLLCGPEEMVYLLKEKLISLGIEVRKIKYELFYAAKKTTSRDTPITISKFKGVSKVVAKLNGAEHRVMMNSDEQTTILDALLRNNIDAPYSCKNGVCSGCLGKLTKGSVVMDSCHSLTPDEIKQGYVLTCQAHPSSEEVYLTYDVKA